MMNARMSRVGLFLGLFLLTQVGFAGDGDKVPPAAKPDNKTVVDAAAIGFDGTYPYPIPNNAQVLIRIAPYDLAAVGAPDKVDYADARELVNRFTFTDHYGLERSGHDGQWSVPLLFKFNQPNRRTELPTFLKAAFNFDFGGGEDVTRINGWRWWFFQSQHCEVLASKNQVEGAYKTKLAYLSNCSNPGQQPSCSTTEEEVWVMMVRYLAPTEAIHDKNTRDLPDDFLRFPRVATRRFDEAVIKGEAISSDPLSRKKIKFDDILANNCGYFAGPKSNDPRYMNPHYVTVLLTEATDLQTVLTDTSSDEKFESTFDEWTDLWTTFFEQDAKYDQLMKDAAFLKAAATSASSVAHQAEKEALKFINRENYNLSWMRQSEWLGATIPTQKGWDKGIFR